MVSISLQKDAADVRAMLVDAVRRYSAKQKPTPTTRIDLAFSLGDSESTPWVHLHFDTKLGSEPDGDPTHPDYAKLSREDWLPAVKAVCEDQTVSVIQADGKTIACRNAELAATIGSFLVDTLLAARDDGVFGDLPKSDRCEMGVEDPTTGEFGWPRYDERGKTNIIQ